MLWSRYVIGYHGCDAKLAKAVAAGKETLKPSNNEYDWLGNGIYFWEGSYQRALAWAKEAKQRGKIQQPAVIGAVIDLGECLNLIETEYLDMVRQAYDYLESFLTANSSPMPENTGQDMLARKLDCAVFNSLHQMRNLEDLPGFDTIRAFFIEGEDLYPGAGVRDKDHIQLCVCDSEKILGYFLPLTKP